MHCRPLYFQGLAVLRSKYPVFDCRSTRSNSPVSNRETAKQSHFLHRLGTALFLVPLSEPNLRKLRNLSLYGAHPFGSEPNRRLEVLKGRRDQRHARSGKRVFRPSDIEVPSTLQRLSKRVIALWLAGRLLKTKDGVLLALGRLGMVGSVLG